MATDPDLPVDDEDEDEPSALEDAFVRYQDNGLRLPPVPRHLVDELDEFADWRWGSDDLNLEDREGIIESARQPGGADSVGFGHVGHGVNSWWLCYRLQLPTLAVYVRQAYGGVYTDDDVVPEINETAAALEELIPAAVAAHAAGRYQGGHRLIVVVDEKQPGFWQIAGAPDDQGKARGSNDPLADALAFLSQPLGPDDDA